MQRKKHAKKNIAFSIGKWAVIIDKTGLFNNMMSLFSGVIFFNGSLLFSQKEWKFYGTFAFIVGSALLLFAAIVQIVHQMKIKRAESSA